MHRHAPLSLLALALISSALFAEDGPNAVTNLLDQYETLATVAGLGADEEDGKSFWEARFEGALATEVELSNPHMTMSDAAGNYYIADKESHSVLKVTPDGRIWTFAGTHDLTSPKDSGKATEVSLNNPNGLYALANGVVYILDFGNQRICKVTLDGQLTTLLHDPSGFGPGRALWVHPNEDLIYFNGSGSVKRWTPSKGIETLVSGLTDPGNLDVGPNGDLIITDRLANQAFRVTPDGRKTLVAGNGLTGEPGPDGRPATEVALESVRGVAILPDNSFLLVTQKGGDAIFVDTQGLAYRFLSGTPRGEVHEGNGAPLDPARDVMSEPRAITLAPNGDLIITTNDNGRVRVVKKKQRPRPAAPELHRLPDQSIRLTWPGASGQAYRLEVSRDGRNWALLAEGTSTDDGVEYRETIANSTPRLFRLR